VRVSFVLLFIALFAWPTDARAACFTCSCTVSTDTLSFGSITPLAGQVDAVGEIDVSCFGLTTGLDSMTISLSTGGSGTYASRRMINGANTLAYNLYSDAGRTVIWGNGTGGSSSLVVQNQLSLLSWSTSTPVYARIPSAPSTRPGTYTDTIVVTVVW
jgi:spore coat protein U-like protein